MTASPLCVILESTVESDCPQVEIDELRANSEEIGAALQANGYRTKIIPFTLDLVDIREQLLELKPVAAFNLVDSIEGKGNLVQIAPLLLEHMGLPFTGTGSMAMTTSCDKLVAKQILTGAGLPTAKWLTESEIEAGKTPLSRPYILKAITEHASFGMFADSIVADAATLKTRWQEKKAQHGSDWFAEEFIDGREFNISVVGTPEGPRVLPCAEIVFTEEFPKDAPKIVDYAAKWYEESGECKGTIRNFDFQAEDEDLLKTLQRMSLQCWELFGLAGYARVDFRIDHQGNPYILEANANPFLTANEGLGAAASRMGLSFPQVIGKIVEQALGERKPEGKRRRMKWRSQIQDSDVDAVRRLVRATGVFNEEEIAVAAELAQDRVTGEEDSDYHFIFGEKDGAVVAYSCFGRIPFTDERFDLYWIAVLPGAQRRGLAAELLGVTEDAVREMGGKKLYAETSSRTPYEPAIKFYTRQGFSLSANLKDFYRENDNKLTFEKNL